MSVGRAAPARPARAAILFGFLAAFVAAVEAIRWVRPDLLLDPDPAWLWMRLLLALAVVAAAAAAGFVAIRLFAATAASRLGSAAAAALPFRGAALAVLGLGAILVGGALRGAGATTVPGPLWVDDASEVPPALALRGAPSDVPPWAYPVPNVPGKWGGSVGTLYLELFRVCLRVFGTTMAGVRAPSVLGGVLSLLTAALLGRALLPRGGAALTALILGGLRWQILMSHWGWNAMLLAPVLDLAALCMLEARRRSRPAFTFALASGALAGLGAHVHLSAWIGASALGLWALWPQRPQPDRGGQLPARLLRAMLFAASFAVVAAPLVLRGGEYFARLGASSAGAQNAGGGAARPLTLWDSVTNAEAALTGPWWTPDPFTRHDLPGRSRVGVVVGIALAAALLRALLSPRDELSAFLLSSAAAAFASTMVWGRQGTPNSYRYVYLTTATAVAAAGGALWLLSAIAPARRRLAALGIVGAVAVAGAYGARDALVRWPSLRETFDGFHGEDTLLGRAAARWEAYGAVSVTPGLGTSDLTIAIVRRYRLDTSPPPTPAPAPGRRAFRIVRPAEPPGTGERVVERVRDGWGRSWALVLGRREGPA